MRDFSIDVEAEKIHSELTKDYFQEVIKSYYNENYRSAVVMLYSITLCDLIFKLRFLKEIYSDATAVSILDRIETLQKNNSVSPEWENKLIKFIKDETDLLEPADFLNIDALQKHRHLCAHPVITQNYELYRPNKETVRAHIRNVLEGLLTKPPRLSRKIFQDLLVDLSENTNLLLSDQDLTRYLESKYFKNLNLSVEKKLFKDLWKIVFRLDNVDANKNRNINFRALMIFLKRNYSALISEINTDKDYFSLVHEVAIKELVTLLDAYPAIYELMNEHAQIFIRKTIFADANLKAKAWFINHDLAKHIELIFQPDFYDNMPPFHRTISLPTIISLSEIVSTQIGMEAAHNMAIRFYAESDSFAGADVRFSGLIRPNLNDFNEMQLGALIDSINTNSQIYNRSLAFSTNLEVKRVVDEKIPAFDYSVYENFIRSIGKKFFQ